MNFESNVPYELCNPRGLRKMKALYAEQLLEHGDDCPQMVKLRNDIEVIEHELTMIKPSTRAASAP